MFSTLDLQMSKNIVLMKLGKVSIFISERGLTLLFLMVYYFLGSKWIFGDVF